MRFVDVTGTKTQNRPIPLPIVAAMVATFHFNHGREALIKLDSAEPAKFYSY